MHLTRNIETSSGGEGLFGGTVVSNFFAFLVVAITLEVLLFVTTSENRTFNCLHLFYLLAKGMELSSSIFGETPIAFQGCIYPPQKGRMSGKL